jgi:hypothetical protein
MVQREQQNKWKLSVVLNTIKKDNKGIIQSLKMKLSNDFIINFIDAPLIASE